MILILLIHNNIKNIEELYPIYSKVINNIINDGIIIKKQFQDIYSTDIRSTDFLGLNKYMDIGYDYAYSIINNNYVLKRTR